MRQSHALAVLAIVAVAASVFGAKEDLYAITGARVVTVSGATLESGTVVMRDGREVQGPALSLALG